MIYEEGKTICDNCKKKIKNLDTACYSKQENVFFCSLDCLTNWSHEYLGCIPIDWNEDSKKTSD